jgi:hypothetical protein
MLSAHRLESGRKHLGFFVLDRLRPFSIAVWNIVMMAFRAKALTVPRLGHGLRLRTLCRTRGLATVSDNARYVSAAST